MKTIGTIRIELVYSHPVGNSSASAVVPPECFVALDAQKNKLGCKTVWWEDVDPHTGVKRPALTPLSSGRITMIEGQGIRHGDRFTATININEVTRQRNTRREMWLIAAQPLPHAKTNTAP